MPSMLVSSLVDVVRLVFVQMYVDRCVCSTCCLQVLGQFCILFVWSCMLDVVFTHFDPVRLAGMAMCLCACGCHRLFAVVLWQIVISFLL